MPEELGKTKLFVWDLPTRLFHWLLVSLVAIAWLTGDEEGIAFAVHQLAGYGILAAIVFRLVWGLAGSRHSLFRDFVHSWHSVRDYAGRLARLRPPPSVGHNPLGGWMILLMLATLTGAFTTGAFASEDEMVGPLAHLISPASAHVVAEAHEVLANVLLALIGIHVAGVLADMVLTRDNLVRAMWTGYKTLPAEIARAEGASAAPYWRAALGLLLGAGVAWLVAML